MKLHTLTRKQLVLGLCLGLLLLVQGAICLYYARFALIDDAFIAFRYADHLVQGHGLVYNIGERVEGYTCFLWVLLLAAASALGLDLVVTSKILGAIFLGLTLILTARFFPKDPLRPAWSLLCAPALVVANAGLALWSVHGLETALFCLLLTLALGTDLRDHGGDHYHIGWSATFYALATLTRPEGLLVFGAVTLYWILAQPKRLAFRPFWGHVLQYAAVVLPYWLWRFEYYGYPFPNTYYAKVGATSAVVLRGLRYVGDFFGGFSFLMLIAIIPALLAARTEKRLRFLLWAVVSYLAVVAIEGGDIFPAFRFIVPISPILYLLLQEGAYHLFEWSRLAASRRILAGVLALIACTGVYLHSSRLLRGANAEAVGGDQFTRDMTLAGLCLKQYVPPTTRIALNPAGAVPYYSGLYAYDMLGLTNEHIAHTPVSNMGTGGAGHEKGNGEYILDRAPEIILFQSVRISREGPVDLSKLVWSPNLLSEYEITQSARIKRGMYVSDQLPLGNGQYLLFWRRYDFFIDRLPNKAPQ